MVKISIIVPVYNSESYLGACISSLLLQSFGDFEICLVNDGSTDNSGLLCDHLAERDNRIKVLHTVNHGAAHARQQGLAHAVGEYIYFMDSDDTMPADGLQRLVEKAMIHPSSDIIVGFCRKSSRLRRSEVSIRTYRNMLIKGRHNIGTLWGKLFKRTLFAAGIPTLPKQLVMGEDMLINIYLACRTTAKVQLVLGKPVYDYIQRNTGISRRFVLTPDYKYDFHNERLKMIPGHLQNDYLDMLIYRRLRMLRRLVREARHTNTLTQLEKSPFVIQLAADVCSSHYSFWKYPRLSVWKVLRKVQTEEKN